MLHVAFFFIHFLKFFYGWYSGAVWGNVFVILIVTPLGWLWSRTKFWPLKPLHRKLDGLFKHHETHHAHLEAQDEILKGIHESLTDLHNKHDTLHERIKKLE